MTLRDSIVPLLLALVVFAAPAQALGAEELPAESPFLPAPGEAPSEAAPKAGYELVGVTHAGEQTLVSILRLEDERSVWIPVGQKVGDIAALRYDAARESATIRIRDQEMTLTLRRASTAAPAKTMAETPPPVPSGDPVAAAVPGVPTQPLSPREEKEMEARMLVSDLLEIGQQQRKAYEEARRKAAAENAAAKAPPTSAPKDTAPAPRPDSDATPTKKK